MTSKIEMAARLREAGISLPDNWGKLSTSRAQAFVDSTLDSPKVKGGLKRLAASMGAAAAAMGAAAISAAGSFLEAATAATDYSEAVTTGPSGPPEGYVRKTLLNPGWARSTGGNRGWYPSYPAADPDPITRQVRRQNERRLRKMPIGARQSVWHDLRGFGKVGSGKKGYAV